MRTTFRILSASIALLILVGVAYVATSGQATPAAAFGSVDLSVIGQKSVHEKLTRTLSCDADAAVRNCFEPTSISVLAGGAGTFGAVGEPDNPLDGMPNPAARHCDNIDYGFGSYQTIDEAQASFDACLDWFQSYMDFAVMSAAGLLSADGTIDGAATDIVNAFGSTFNSCSFPDPKKGNSSNDSAKCNVLNGLGRALHAYEDIWSHSNWGDVADPAKPVDIANPSGMGMTEQPWFMAYPGPRSAPIPAGLISGCDDSLSRSECQRTVAGDQKVVQSRTGHSMLNKDNGDVDPGSCTASNPLSSRGKIVVDGTSNFTRAVTGGCGAAARAWTDLQNALIAKYGASSAAMMIRAITSDHPLTACEVSGSSSKANISPTRETESARSVQLTVINRTAVSLNCSTAVLDGGEWVAYPPDSITSGSTGVWGTQSHGFATGTEGQATFQIAETTGLVTIRWDNPYWGSSSFSCEVTPGYTCAVSGGRGNNSSVTATITGG